LAAINLDLDFGADRRSNRAIARVFVAFACGYAQDGGGPTLTADCADSEHLAREIERLKGELDSVLARAEARFEGMVEPPTPEREPAPAEAPEPRAKPQLGGELRVSDLMTRDVKTLRRNDKLSVADELMKVGRFRHAVVLDSEGEVVGVVSQRSIFYGALAWSMGQGQVAHQKELDAHPVKDVMESDPVTVHPEAPLSEAAATMMARKIGCLPVVDSGRLVGILTEGDFLRMMTGF
jgi:CBS domain-containing membrane protein